MLLKRVLPEGRVTLSSFFIRTPLTSFECLGSSKDDTMLIGVTQLLAEFLTGKRTNKIQVLTLDEDLKTTITPTSSIVKNELNYCGVMLCNGGADGAVVKAVNRYAPGFTAATRIPWRMVKKASDDPNLVCLLAFVLHLQFY